MTDETPPPNRQLGDFANVDKADADDLVARLDAMRTLDAFRTYKAETFELMRVGPGSHVADIGCGTGDDARMLADRVSPGGTAVGIDLSAEMLAQAQERHAGVPGLAFQQAGSDTLGVPDGSLDAIRADRVLIHVPDPARTLAEMIRTLKPGGRIVISEPDMPGCWVASDNYPLTNRVMDHIAASCITPYLARDLWAMFKDAGLTDVGLQVRTVTAHDPRSVARILDLGGVAAAMAANGLLDPAEVEAWIADFMRRGATGRFVGSLCIVVASGTKS